MAERAGAGRGPSGPDASRPVYVISVAAELVSVHPRTLRIYEGEGLVCPARTPTNIRLYSEIDLRRILWIRHLTQNLGVNLAGVRVLFELEERLGTRILETLYSERNDVGKKDGAAPTEPPETSTPDEQRTPNPERTAKEYLMASDPKKTQKKTRATEPATTTDSAETSLSGPRVMPLVALRETVIFPEMIVPLQVGREKSVKALDKAVAEDSLIALVTQRKAEQEDIDSANELYEVGTLAKIAQVVQSQDGTVRAIVQGQQRLRLVSLESTDEYISAAVEVLDDEAPEDLEVEALIQTVQGQIEQYVQSGAPVPPEAAVAARNITEPGLLADMVAYSPDMTTEQRQELLETLDVMERLKLVSTFLARQVEILELKGRIQSEVKSELDKTQREYILREQLKAIQRELGEDDPQQAEVSELREKVEEANMPQEVKERALKEVDRMSRIPTASPEVGVIRTYVDWLAGLPWDNSTEDNLDIKKAAVILDEDHYGLEKVKERILEYLAVRSLADTIRSPILALVGPPGVGKTSLGKSVARAMGREFVRMSLGGIHDEAEIRGHRRTYIGALPGRVIQNIKTAGTNNPVFMLDEIDKIGMDFRGDPSSALLEVLDPEQNNSFADNYLEVPFDLSKVLFIATGNLIDPIPMALRDRMEIIQLPGYTQREKAEIGRRFLVPKQMENHGLKPKNITITDEAMTTLVQSYTHEAGVRNLEREIANVMRKVARTVAEGRKSKTTVNDRKLKALLGPTRFDYGELETEDQTGAATGLVVTAVGGDVVSVEVTRMEGKEDFILTGQLGDVMRESARAGLSWTRANATRLGIKRELFEKNTMHIHVPAGAIPKDGPSAGITMATAIVSSLTGIPVRKDVAMTGEITLRGRVLPIGGLKFKILAAHLSGAKMVIIKKNERDLEDVPEEIRKQLKIVAVDNMDQVLAAALRRKPRALKPSPTTLKAKDDAEPKTPQAKTPVFPPEQPPTVA